MNEVAFLKDEIGPVLAKGIAEVMVMNPRDPVGFLGHWLFHHLDVQRSTELKHSSEQEKEMCLEEAAKLRLEEEKASAMILQREWRAHQTAQRERALRESELTELFQELSVTAEERYNVDDAIANIPPSDTSKEPGDAEEQELTVLNVQADVLFQRSLLFLEGLTKEHIARIKYQSMPSTLTHRIIRAALYLSEHKSPAQVGYGEDWKKCVSCIRPYAFLQHMRAYNPFLCNESGAPLTSIRTIERVRRLLKDYSDEEARADTGGMAVFLIFQFVRACVESRRAYNDIVVVWKNSGKDTLPPHRLFAGDSAPPLEAWECIEVVEDDEVKDIEEEPIRLQEEIEKALAEERRQQEEKDLENAGDDANGTE